MRKAAFLLFAFFCAAPAFAQVGFKSTNVWFPNMDVGGDPNGLRYVTLVEASNNTSSFSTGVLTVYSATGTAMPVSFDGQAPAASLNFEMDSGVVRQIQISSTGEITQGWIQITYTPNLAETTVIAQYLGGSSILSEVGINPFFNSMTDTTLGPATVFPVETNLSSSLNTGIAIANPNAAQVVRVQLLSAATIVGTTNITLPQYGYTAKLLTELFPNVPDISQMTAEVGLTSCTTTACTALGPGLIATALRLNIATGLFTAVPVVPTPLGGEVVRNIPHIAFGGSPAGINFQTVLYLTNPTSSGVFGTANLFDNNGDPIAAANGGATPLSSFPFSALPGSAFKITLSGGSALQSGWLQLTQSDGTIPLIVNALFQTYNGPTVISEANVLESPAFPEGLIYVHLTPGITNVGVALANPQSTPNTVTLTLYNQAGFTDTSFQHVVTLPPFGHLAQYVTEMFPQLAGTSFDGTLSTQSGSGFSSVALRQNGASVVGFAALPVYQGVMFVPSITNIQITSTTRFNGGTVSFIISVADYSSSLVFPAASPVVEAAEWVFYPNTNQQDGAYGFEQDGSPMINAQTGTLTGTFQSENANTIPSGTPAVFYIDIIDSLDNYSNVISIPFKF